MTATLAGSQAALKILYPNGELPKDINEQYMLLKRLKKETNFTGESAYVALQNANPQGTGRTVANAQTALYQGNYVRFNLTRVSHYGLARVTGEAAQAAVKEEGALTDLWDNETKGAAQTEMNVMAAYLYGTGDATLAALDGSGAVAATTITLSSSANMNYFELNALLGAVSTTGLSPTVRTGSARVTGIDRRSRTLTSGSNWSTQITGLTNTDYLVRYGDNAASGTGYVITGLGAYVVGGTAPGTLHGLNRNTDPVRLAGQAIDYSGWAMEDAIVDASAQSGFQGIGYPNVIVANNIDVANMKKSLGAKIHFERPGGKEGSHGFSSLTIEGEDGPVEVLADPFCPRNKAWMLRLSDFCLWSLKAAPHLQKFDGLDFLRVATEDSFEVRFAFYGNLKCKNPGPHVQLQNFGVG
jgi:hypothetical protein